MRNSGGEHMRNGNVHGELPASARVARRDVGREATKGARLIRRPANRHPRG